ncbi:MAG TPA: AmmeMemoRadiSam system protein B [Deltaproteobacteria bacterium]|nr:AmmeMemoRadiSam system protein B [Deltaproteobacteria bacterium]
MTIVRKPSVVYQFYPGDPVTLEKTVKGMVEETLKKEDAIAIIAPHAGYVYSGRVAGAIFSKVRIPDNIILLGPNHTGLGKSVAVFTSGEWEMPFGKMMVNSELSHILIEESVYFADDPIAHLKEHSLEVQLPFIHHFNPAASIVPITIMHLDLRSCIEIGKAVARVIISYEKEILIVVSSDMNHYESHETTKKKDKKAIERITVLDYEGLLKTVLKDDISMCGVIPAAIAIIAARELGANGGKLIDYATSGETSGDFNHVVGYAGILIK